MLRCLYLLRLLYSEQAEASICRQQSCQSDRGYENIYLFLIIMYHRNTRIQGYINVLSCKLERYIYLVGPRCRQIQHLTLVFLLYQNLRKGSLLFIAGVRSCIRSSIWNLSKHIDVTAWHDHGKFQNINIYTLGHKFIHKFFLSLFTSLFLSEEQRICW